MLAAAGPYLPQQRRDHSNMDVEMEDASSQGEDAGMYGYAQGPPSPVTAAGTTTAEVDPGYEQVDMGYGYEDCPPQARRGSMTAVEQTERRASIKAIMANGHMSPMTKRRSIQHLMDGRRSSISGASCGSGSIAPTTPYLSDADENSTVPSHGCFGSITGSVDSGDGQYGYGQDGNGQAFSPTAGFTICNAQTRHAEESRPPCTHYDRNCTIVAPCCGAAFGCRICHDDCPNLPPKINNGGLRYHRSASLPGSFTTMNQPNSHPTSFIDDNDGNHAIDRFAIREVICRMCCTRQSSKTDNCVNCGVLFGAYHCNICNLWMSDEERPYHCKDCGFCRVGGEENFRHCHDCGMCIDKTLYDTHNCKAGKYKSNCPVCQEYLFSSRSASHEMPCGHAIHWECFKQLAAHDSRCPLCKKTAETRERMLPAWNAMAGGVALQPVPPELARVVDVSCIDCEKFDAARAWHFLGVQCRHCSSFNTVVDRIILTGEEAYEYLQANGQAGDAAPQHPEGEGPPQRRVNRRRSLF